MEYSKQILNRLKRIEGQIKGVSKMMEEEQDCQNVITQLSAIRSAVDRTIGTVVSSNLEQCIIANIKSGEETERLVKEAVNLLVKSR
ncbi:MAG: metal-sensitive transcriptional regulator [Ectobacillus sp.]